MPGDTIPGTYCKHYALSLDRCPGTLSPSDTWQLTESQQTIKKNKDVCVGMLEQIHKLLYAIIQVHMTSTTGGELSLAMLKNLGNSTE